MSKPRLELLEDRLAPATHRWTGLGADNNWMTAANWVEVETSLVRAPDSADDTLVFPAGAAQPSNQNNFPADTAFAGITFQTGSYVVSGNRIALGSGGVTSQGGSPSTLAAPILLGSSTVPFHTDGDLVISGVISGPLSNILRKAGASFLILSGANTYAAPTQIFAGVLRAQHATALGTAEGGTLLTGGAVLELDGGVAIAAEGLTSAAPTGGTLRSRGGSNSWGGIITLSTNMTVIAESTGPLTVSGLINGPASSQLNVDAPGQLEFAGSVSNTYTGTTNVRIGELLLNKSSGATAVPGPLLIGLADLAATVRLNANNQIANGSSVSIQNAASTLDVNGFAETIGPLSLTGGSVTTGTGFLNLGGDVEVNPAAASATISGRLDLGTATRQFTVQDGPAANDLVVSAVISGGAGRDLLKSGPGWMVFNGANNYAGATQVSAGVLTIQNGLALGSTSAGTTVSAGAALELQGGISVGEPITINGVGTTPSPDETGALRSTGGANSWTGSVTLGDTGFVGVSVGVDADTLTISGVIGSPGGAFGIRKNGLGRLVLTAANTYTGPALIDDGILNIRHASALGTAASFTDVFNEATLEIEGGINIGNEELRLIGTGAGGIGAVRSVSGNNSWAGPVFLNSFSESIHVVAGELTLSGNLSGSSIITLSKQGAGRLTLTSDTSFDGTFIVDGGALRATGNLSGADVVLNAGTLEGSGGVGALTAHQGTVSPGTTGVGTLEVNGNLLLERFSTYAVQLGTSFLVTPRDELNVTGGVRLSSATLQVLSLSTSAPVGTTFLIIRNDGSDSVIGTFLGLAEGGVLILPDGRRLQITYQGGDGNDVVLTRINAPALFPGRAVTTPIAEGGNAVLTGRISDPDAGDTFFLDVNWGDGTPVRHVVYPPSAPRDVRLTHRYRDNPAGAPTGSYTIQLAWRDQHGAGNSGNLSVQVNNVAPEVDAGPSVLLNPSRQLHRIGSFADPGADTWTGTVDYGDGSGVESLDLLPGQRFRLRHRYDEPGLYRVTVTVRDDDGGVDQDSFWVLVPFGPGGAGPAGLADILFALAAWDEGEQDNPW